LYIHSMTAKKTVPRDQRVRVGTFRFAEKDIARLRQLAKRWGVSRSEAIRLMIAYFCTTDLKLGGGK